MTEKIEPALTPEMWKLCLDDPPSEDQWNWGGNEIVLGYGATRHGLAALALHGQPYGFTWDDVDALEVVYRRVIALPSPLGRELAAAIERLHDHAARVAALLPPRQET